MSPKEPPRSGEPSTLDEAGEKRRQVALRELEAEWDRKLACLNYPDAHDKVEAMFDAQGRTKKRPKAGETF
jgi:hypothetical protein